MFNSLSKIYYLIYSVPSRIVLSLKNVRLGRHIYFGGVPVVHRCKGSDIVIGDSCRFMSKFKGNNIGINHKCILSTQNDKSVIKIGSSCGFSGTSIWCFERIIIGDNVRVGANSVIMDGDAHQDDPRSGNNAPVYIGNNVWIGANVIVLKGIKIGDNSLVGAGSVVTHDIPANVVAAGNPCRVIKQLSEETIKKLSK